MIHQRIINRRIRDRTIKIIDKYALMKRFNHDHQLEVYMYDFMCVYPETIPMEDYRQVTKKFVENYKKM